MGNVIQFLSYPIAFAVLFWRGHNQGPNTSVHRTPPHRKKAPIELHLQQQYIRGSQVTLGHGSRHFTGIADQLAVAIKMLTALAVHK